jgi:hypothetical protein
MLHPAPGLVSFLSGKRGPLPRDEPLNVGNGLDPLADLLRQLDDDPL